MLGRGEKSPAGSESTMKILITIICVIFVLLSLRNLKGDLSKEDK